MIGENANIRAFSCKCLQMQMLTNVIAYIGKKYQTILTGKYINNCA